MSITELDLYCRDIATSYSINHLSGLRAVFQKMLHNFEISRSIYDGLNKDIRDRSDWLKRRG